MEKRLNFRVQFELHPRENNDRNWYSLCQTMANWINRIVDQPQNSKEIFEGLLKGYMNYLQGGVKIKVKSEKGKNYKESPSLWALEFKHEDRSGDLKGWRFWVNDIAIEKIEGGVLRFSLTNSYGIKSGYIGRIQEPSITSPNIIKELLNHDYWSCIIQGEKLGLFARPVNNETVKAFNDFIFSSTRVLPIVYISQYRHGDLAFDPEIIAKSTAGNAHVFFEEESSVSEYLKSFKYFDNYRCSFGAVRIYLPNINRQNSNDHFRHRFFTFEQITSEGAFKTQKIIAESIVRRSLFIRPFPLGNVRDIDIMLLSNRLNEALENGQNNDIVALYQEQISLLKSQIIEKDSEMNEYISMYDSVNNDKSIIEGDNDALRSKIFALESQVNQMKEEHDIDTLDRVYLPDFFPNSIIDFLNYMEENFSQLLVVLPEAKDSAQRHRLKDLEKAWSLLRTIPCLHRIIFQEESGDKKKMFNNETGFDLSMTEGKTTKANTRLIQERTRSYNGQNIECLAHIGFGSKPDNLLRIHFYVDNEQEKIVIGHCGEHLENASSRKI
jgi:hypothetical protein